MSIFLPSTVKEIQSWVDSRINLKQGFRICGKWSRFVNIISDKSENISKDILSLKKLIA